MDGAVYEWNTLSGVRESESVLKSCSYTSVAISPESKTFFAVGKDCTLKEIQDCQVATGTRFMDWFKFATKKHECLCESMRRLRQTSFLIFLL